MPDPIKKGKKKPVEKKPKVNTTVSNKSLVGDKKADAKTFVQYPAGKSGSMNVEKDGAYGRAIKRATKLQNQAANGYKLSKVEKMFINKTFHGKEKTFKRTTKKAK